MKGLPSVSTLSAMICKCGCYLVNNVIPYQHLYLLLSQASIEQTLLTFEQEHSQPSLKIYSARHQKKKEKMAVFEQETVVIRQRLALYKVSTLSFICPECSRLHIFLAEDKPPASYLLVSEHPQAEGKSLTGEAGYRLLPDVCYDTVVEALPTFQEQLARLSVSAWLRTDGSRIILEWEQGWWSEYQWEYGAMPLIPKRL